MPIKTDGGQEEAVVREDIKTMNSHTKSKHIDSNSATLAIHKSFTQQTGLPDNFVHMKKFTNLNTTHHHRNEDQEEGSVTITENQSNFNSDEGVDSIMISHSDHMLEETTAHLLHVHNHKREQQKNHQIGRKESIATF